MAARAPRTTLTTGARRALHDLSTELGKASPTEAMTVALSASQPSSSADIVMVMFGEGGAVVQRTAVDGMPRPHDIQLFFQTLQRMRATPKAPSLPDSEAALLDSAGFTEDPMAAALVLERSQRDLDELLSPRGSLSLEQAAIALGVSTSRLRQRLGAGSLYGVKVGRDWRIPLFQFQKKGVLVRNLEAVLPSIRKDAHPLAVRSFFESESPDLVIDGSERPVSPRAWLAAGYPAADVVALAADI
jgi:hypothetical protein